MAGSALPNIDYYFRRERLSDDGGERAHSRIVDDLTEAKAGGLLCDFRVIEHAEAFPTHADESALLKRLREFATVKKIGLDIPHLHPWMRETFDVIDGEITFIVDGKERVVKAGSRIVIAPGSTHAFQNVTNRPAYMITRLEAATEGPWKELANEGRLGDSGFVQFGRVGGMGAAGPIQMMVFGHRFNYVARMAGMPIWLQDVLSFLVPPTARLFGIHAYYPPNKSASDI